MRTINRALRFHAELHANRDFVTRILNIVKLWHCNHQINVAIQCNYQHETPNLIAIRNIYLFACSIFDKWAHLILNTWALVFEKFCWICDTLNRFIDIIWNWTKRIGAKNAFRNDHWVLHCLEGVFYKQKCIEIHACSWKISLNEQSIPQTRRNKFKFVPLTHDVPKTTKNFSCLGIDLRTIGFVAFL